MGFTICHTVKVQGGTPLEHMFQLRLRFGFSTGNTVFIPSMKLVDFPRQTFYNTGGHYEPKKMAPAELWKRLAALEPAEVARRAGVRLDDGAYAVDVLNEVYRIDPRALEVVRTEPPVPSKPDFNRSIAIVAYLIGAEAVDPVGEWVGPRDLPGGREFFIRPHEVPVHRIVERFGSDKGAFEEACKMLGGRPEQYADAAFSFLLFPRLPVAVLLWLEDEEFPARATMLVDRTASRHFQLDALWAGLKVVRSALVAAAGRKGEEGR